MRAQCEGGAIDFEFRAIQERTFPADCKRRAVATSDAGRVLSGRIPKITEAQKDGRYRRIPEGTAFVQRYISVLVLRREGRDQAAFARPSVGLRLSLSEAETAE